jgi:hypothetical protein
MQTRRSPSGGPAAGRPGGLLHYLTFHAPASDRVISRMPHMREMTRSASRALIVSLCMPIFGPRRVAGPRQSSTTPNRGITPSSGP